MPLPTEFSRIARLFAPLAAPEGLGLTDDAAVFMPPPGRELVVTADAMVEGVHWLRGEAPGNVARKLLRVNLSDLAAMGAVPLHYALTFAAPRDTDDAWFAAFAAGLAEDQARYGVSLLGGDSTSTSGPVSLSVTMFGHVAPGAALRRSGAREGDTCWVTGVIGDGVLGLWALQGGFDDPDGSLARHYRLPEPRIGLPLADVASAAMDISDGLVQDARHMARASNVTLMLEPHLVPLSAGGRRAGADFVTSGVAGGDDYELLLAVPSSKHASLRTVMRDAGVPITRIGRFVAGPGEVRAAGAGVTLGGGGWSHF